MCLCVASNMVELITRFRVPLSFQTFSYVVAFSAASLETMRSKSQISSGCLELNKGHTQMSLSISAPDKLKKTDVEDMAACSGDP